MNISKKTTFGIGVCLLLSTLNINASTYVVKKGDNLAKIAYKLGFKSIAKAKFQVPSGDINKIFPGDILHYTKRKRKRIVYHRPINLDKFCFKDNRSIHYRAEERCQ